MSGTRQGSTLALPLENQPRTEETEGTLVSGAAEMVTGQFGLIPLGSLRGQGPQSSNRLSGSNGGGYRCITTS